MLGLEAILAYPDGRGSLPTSPLTKFFYILEHLEHTNRTTTILSFTSLAVLILARVTKGFAMTRPGGKWVRFIPEILLVVAGTTGGLLLTTLTLADLVQLSRGSFAGI